MTWPTPAKDRERLQQLLAEVIAEGLFLVKKKASFRFVEHCGQVSSRTRSEMLPYVVKDALIKRCARAATLSDEIAALSLDFGPKQNRPGAP